MALRYRKSINLGGGFRVNFSKSGVGYSWGTKGYRVTKKAGGGVRKTYSIPGTGLSWVDDSSSKKRGTSNRGVTPAQAVTVESHNLLYQASETDVNQLVTDNSQDFIEAIKKYKDKHENTQLIDKYYQTHGTYTGIIEYLNCISDKKEKT